MHGFDDLPRSADPAPPAGAWHKALNRYHWFVLVVAALRRVALEAGQHEQVVDEAAEPAVTVGQLPYPRAVPGDLGMADRHFQAGAEPCDGGAELMGGVGDEAPLPIR